LMMRLCLGLAWLGLAGLGWAWLDRSGPYCVGMDYFALCCDGFWLCWAVLGRAGPCRAVLGRAGPCWAVLGRAGPLIYWTLGCDGFGLV
jgi:hypothetical protein